MFFLFLFFFVRVFFYQFFQPFRLLEIYEFVFCVWWIDESFFFGRNEKFCRNSPTLLWPILNSELRIEWLKINFLNFFWFKCAAVFVTAMLMMMSWKMKNFVIASSSNLNNNGLANKSKMDPVFLSETNTKILVTKSHQFSLSSVLINFQI